MTGSKASRTAIAGSAAIGLVALAWASFAKPLPLLVYNPSNSVPVGWYRVEPLLQQPSSLQVSSIVLVHLPAEAAALAAQRGYLGEWTLSVVHDTPAFTVRGKRAAERIPAKLEADAFSLYVGFRCVYQIPPPRLAQVPRSRMR